MVVPTAPRVGVVVVNWFGGDRTMGCLESLTKLTWPADRLAVALVDNGSEPGWLDGLRQRYPTVRVVEAGANLGFGGACNRGFSVLTDCDYVALLNNDAIPSPDWLEPLVAVFEADPRVGAATPKVLLDARFVSVTLASPTVRPGDSDTRALGVQLCGARVGGEDVSDRVELVSGFWGWEHDTVTVGGRFAWTDGRGVLRLPVPFTEADLVPVELRLACGTGPMEVAVEPAGRDLRLSVGLHPAWFDLGEIGPPVDLINNAGTVLLADGSTADRGYLEPDSPEFAEPSDVWGWSGAAVLLSRRYLDDVGAFDERFFLYYEDADLSWRGRLRGWRYCYEPRSVVRHEHSATVAHQSALVRHLSARNRLLLLVRNGPTKLAVGAAAGLVADILRAVDRDVLRRVARGRRPLTDHVVQLGRVLGSFVRLLPHGARSRMQQRRPLSHVDSTPPQGGSVRSDRPIRPPPPPGAEDGRRG